MNPSMHWPGSLPGGGWCLPRGVCPDGVSVQVGGVWQTPPEPEADPLVDTLEYGQQGGSTHPTGMILVVSCDHTMHDVVHGCCDMTESLRM